MDLSQVAANLSSEFFAKDTIRDGLPTPELLAETVKEPAILYGGSASNTDQEDHKATLPVVPQLSRQAEDNSQAELTASFIQNLRRQNVLQDFTQKTGIEILKTIGKGGMGAVFLGQDRGRKVAVKMIRRDSRTDAVLIFERFQSEQKLHQQFGDLPAVVTFYESGSIESPEGPVPFIVMQYIEPISQKLSDALSAELQALYPNLLSLKKRQFRDAKLALGKLLAVLFQEQGLFNATDPQVLAALLMLSDCRELGGAARNNINKAVQLLSAPKPPDARTKRDIRRLLADIVRRYGARVDSDIRALDRVYHIAHALKHRQTLTGQTLQRMSSVLRRELGDDFPEPFFLRAISLCMSHAAQGLSGFHRKNTSFNDLKASNILLSQEVSELFATAFVGLLQASRSGAQSQSRLRAKVEEYEEQLSGLVSDSLFKLADAGLAEAFMVQAEPSKVQYFFTPGENGWDLMAFSGVIRPHRDARDFFVTFLALWRGQQLAEVLSLERDQNNFSVFKTLKSWTDQASPGRDSMIDFIDDSSLHQLKTLSPKLFRLFQELTVLTDDSTDPENHQLPSWKNVIQALRDPEIAEPKLRPSWQKLALVAAACLILLLIIGANQDVSKNTIPVDPPKKLAQSDGQDENPDRTQSPLSDPDPETKALKDPEDIESKNNTEPKLESSEPVQKLEPEIEDTPPANDPAPVNTPEDKPESEAPKQPEDKEPGQLQYVKALGRRLNTAIEALDWSVEESVVAVRLLVNEAEECGHNDEFRAYENALNDMVIAGKFRLCLVEHQYLLTQGRILSFEGQLHIPMGQNKVTVVNNHDSFLDHINRLKTELDYAKGLTRGDQHGVNARRAIKALRQSLLKESERILKLKKGVLLKASLRQFHENHIGRCQIIIGTLTEQDQAFAKRLDFLSGALESPNIVAQLLLIEQRKKLSHTRLSSRDKKKIQKYLSQLLVLRDQVERLKAIPDDEKTLKNCTDFSFVIQQACAMHLAFIKQGYSFEFIGVFSMINSQINLAQVQCPVLWLRGAFMPVSKEAKEQFFRAVYRAWVNARLLKAMLAFTVADKERSLLEGLGPVKAVHMEKYVKEQLFDWAQNERKANQYPYIVAAVLKLKSHWAKLIKNAARRYPKHEFVRALTGKR